MSLFRRNIMEQTFPSAYVYVCMAGIVNRIIAVLPTHTHKASVQSGILRASANIDGFVMGQSIGNYDYWCLRVQRVSSSIDYFRITILCDCIIDGVLRKAGYTWDVTPIESPRYEMYNIIALDASYTNYAPI